VSRRVGRTSPLSKRARCFIRPFRHGHLCPPAWGRQVRLLNERVALFLPFRLGHLCPAAWGGQVRFLNDGPLGGQVRFLNDGPGSNLQSIRDELI
jgi:hypothetical protein